jgi:hypothetical protein
MGDKQAIVWGIYPINIKSPLPYSNRGLPEDRGTSNKLFDT